jgi:mono/diheme cytochrome c family protein
MVGREKPADLAVRTAKGMTALIIGVALLSIPATGLAQSDEETEQLVLGQEVYASICQACHQPGGVGTGDIPPLLNNPHVDDSDYVKGVIQNGRTGEIEVNGQTYNGTMNPISTLDDTEIDAVIAFLQNDLVVPGGAPPPTDEGTTAGTTLPPVASGMFTLAFVLAIAIAGWVLAPRVVGVIDRGNTPKLDAGLKSGLVVVYFVLATVVIPSAVLQTEVLTSLPVGVQDFVASSLWIGGLAIGVLALWWFQRQDRI